MQKQMSDSARVANQIAQTCNLGRRFCVGSLLGVFAGRGPGNFRMIHRGRSKSRLNEPRRALADPWISLPAMIVPSARQENPGDNVSDLRKGVPKCRLPSLSSSPAQPALIPPSGGSLSVRAMLSRCAGRHAGTAPIRPWPRRHTPSGEDRVSRCRDGRRPASACADIHGVFPTVPGDIP